MSNKLWGFIKVIGVIALLCFMVPIRINQGDAVIEQFKDYMKKYNKSYPNETEYRIRLKAFQVNRNFFLKHLHILFVSAEFSK